MNDNREECSFNGCTKRAKSKGLCQSHYYQQYRGQELRHLKAFAHKRETKSCSGDGCGRVAVSGGLCQTHRKHELQGKPLVTFKGKRPSHLRDDA